MTDTQCKPNILTKISTFVKDHNILTAVVLIIVIIYFIWKFISSLFSKSSSFKVKEKNELDELIDNINESD